jgi:hypothetical protein
MSYFQSLILKTVFDLAGKVKSYNPRSELKTSSHAAANSQPQQAPKPGSNFDNRSISVAQRALT